MKESAIQAKIIKWLRANGWFVLKIIQLSENGFPDIYAYKAGRTIWFETKSPGKELRPLQELRRGQLVAAGMEAYRVDCLEDAKSLIRHDQIRN